MNYWNGTKIVKSKNNDFTANVGRTKPSIMWSHLEETRAKKLIELVNDLSAAERKQSVLAFKPFEQMPATVAWLKK